MKSLFHNLEHIPHNLGQIFHNVRYTFHALVYISHAVENSLVANKKSNPINPVNRNHIKKAISIT